MPRVLLQRDEALGRRHLVRRDVERAGARRAGEGVEQREHLAVLRLLPLRVEPDAELGVRGDLLADGVIVHLPRDLRAGQHQPTGVGTHLVAVLADRPFHEETVARDVRIVGEELRTPCLPAAADAPARDA